MSARAEENTIYRRRALLIISLLAVLVLVVPGVLSSGAAPGEPVAPATLTPADYLPLVVRAQEPTSTSTPTITPLPGETYLPDLVITRMAIELATGGACTFSTPPVLGVHVQFQNVGSAAAGPFVVEVNDAQIAVGGLAAGQVGDLWFSGYNYYGTTVTVIVDATFLVWEISEDNNRRSQQLAIPTLPPTCTPTPTLCMTPTSTTTAACGPEGHCCINISLTTICGVRKPNEKMSVTPLVDWPDRHFGALESSRSAIPLSDYATKPPEGICPPVVTPRTTQLAHG